MQHVTAEILTIGDEILYGQILDTNAQWISAALDEAGIKTVQRTTVGDNEEDILTAFSSAESRADIVLITGGLGPTNDDLTKPCLAKYFDCSIEINPEALEEVTSFFASKGFELTDINRQQAALPLCCEKVSNPLGTAPGMWFSRAGKVFVSMPGVPFEMKNMMTDTIIPKLREEFRTPIIYHKLIRTAGIGESWLADKVKDWENALPSHIHLAYLPSLGEVKLRLTANGDDLSTLQHQVIQEVEKLHELIDEYIYGYDKDNLETVLGRILEEQKKTIALAESCTGGFLSHKLTSVPGASGYFLGSMIAYDNSIKINNLGVDAATIAQHGAVSEATVAQMAQCVRKRFNSDIGIATSGVAGPGGGTPEKPVGTVWIAYADEESTVTKKLQLWKDRDVNIRAASAIVMTMALKRLMASSKVKP